MKDLRETINFPGWKGEDGAEGAVQKLSGKSNKLGQHSGEHMNMYRRSNPYV
jgi:hypothetical protein